MGSFVPHTDTEIEKMLASLGLEEIDDLYDHLPDGARFKGDLSIPIGVSEADVLDLMESLASKNRPTGRELICFAGAGAYDHDFSTAAAALASQSAFVTSYTPYQPEVAQGVLQALFEYQTLISRVAGLDVTNASLYDGGTALVEAVNLACAHSKRSRVLVSRGIHPHYREMIQTYAKGSGHEIVEVGLSGCSTDLDGVSLQGAAALCIGYPNYLGEIEDLEAAKRLCEASGALLVVVYDPVSVATLRSPGDMGADVAVAEGQSLGIPLSFGGPYLGLFSAKSELVRSVPGRLVGETVDVDEKKAYVTTLRTREQDIRREKASSNVCTNQTLIAIQAAIHLSWLGKSGFSELSRRCFSATRYLADGISRIPGAKVLNRNYFREFVVELPIDAGTAIERMAERGFLAGVAIGEGFEESPLVGTLLVTATEKRTKAEIDGYLQTLKEVVAK